MDHNVICSRCGGDVEDSRKGQHYCTACHNENMRIHRKKHSQLSQDQRKKANARTYLNVYLKRGLVIKQPCEICGSKNSQAHHDNYDKPTAVKWFCRKHHLEYHKKLK